MVDHLSSISAQHRRGVLTSLVRQAALLLCQPQPLHQPGKLKPSYDPQQTWPPAKIAAVDFSKITSLDRPACGHVCWGGSASQSTASNASAVMIGRKKSKVYLI